MILYLIVLLGICLWGMHKRKTNDYLSKEQITSVKGIFACIIFFSHLRQYLDFVNEFDIVYSIILSYIGQLMVAIFFFYSGYGIIYSYNTKKNYMETFLVNRILKTWIHFAIAILCFIVVNFTIKIDYPVQTILLSFTGWEEIGNSNWFIFDILILYIATMVSFIILKYAKVGKDKINLALIILVSLCTCLIGIVLHYYKKSWWYNTLFCFPYGMIYYFVKNKVEILLSNRRGYLTAWGGG